MGKEAVVVVLDVNASMGRARAGGETGLDLGKRAVRMLLRQKMLFPGQDEIALVLVGTRGTSNNMNEVDEEQYRHVTIASPFARASVGLLEELDAAVARGQEEGDEKEDKGESDDDGEDGDITDGIIVAMTMIVERVKKLKFTKRIFVVTDAGGAIDESNCGQLAQVGAGFVNNDIRLNIIGVDFAEVDDDSDSDSDSEGEGEDTSMPGADGSSSSSSSSSSAAAAAAAVAAAAEAASDAPARTEVMVRNEGVLRELASAAKGAVVPIEGALDLLNEMQSRKVSAVTSFRGPLCVASEPGEGGERVEVPVWAYVKSSMEAQSLKTEKASSMSANHGKVIRETQHYNKMRDEGDDLVPPEHIVSALNYGRSRVTGYDNAVLKQETEKRLDVLGFVRRSVVPPHYAMGGVDCVVAEPGNARAELALSALAAAMDAKGLVALARFVKRKNAAPVCVALFPTSSAERVQALYAVPMPFAEDVREFAFAPLANNPRLQPSSAQSAAARALIEAMDLDAVPGPDGEPEEALVPERTFNPLYQRFFATVDARAADPFAPVAPVDPRLERCVSVDPAVAERAAEPLATFARVFPLEPKKKKGEEAAGGRRRKRHWRDYLTGAAAAAAGGGGGKAEADDDGAERKEGDSPKRQRPGEDGGAADAAAAAAAAADAAAAGGAPVKIEDLNRRVVDSVGSADPVGDFAAMMSRRDDPAVVGRAIGQMVDLVRGLVLRSMGSSLLGKATECVAALRRGCVEQEEPEKFNASLNQFRLALADRKPAFWTMVRDAGITPIHSGECADSSVSPAEAAAFHAPPPAAAGASKAEAAGGDDDDDDDDDDNLFGGME